MGSLKLKNVITLNKWDYDVDLTIVVSVDNHLSHAEDAPGEIQEDVSDAPTNCALSLIVHKCLKIKIACMTPACYIKCFK